MLVKAKNAFKNIQYQASSINSLKVMECYFRQLVVLEHNADKH